MQTNKSSTRRSLLVSATALILSIAMLVGTTFAWFTDSVVSGNNVIAAGNLDIELYNDGNKVTSQTNLFDGVKWEPGVVDYENFTIKNEGNLALLYDFAMNWGDYNTLAGEYNLTQILKVAMVDKHVSGERAAAIAAGKAAGWKSLSDWSFSGEMTTKGETKDFALIIYWEPSDADNNWNVQNGKTLDKGDHLYVNLGINLQATQKMHESDSFGPDYDGLASDWDGSTGEVPEADEDGVITITTGAELAAFAADVNSGNSYSGKTVKLGADINLGNVAWTAIGDCESGNYFQGTFDGQGHTIYNLNVDYSKDASKFATAGLFGWVDAAAATIKNLNVDGATVKGSHWTGVIAGFFTGTIENCSVNNATVIAYNLNDDANGDKVGGIVGYMNSGAGKLDGNTVTNSTITGNRDVAGLAGAVATTNAVTSNKVENVTVNYSSDNVGEIVSPKTAVVVDDTNTATNVKIIRVINVQTVAELNYALAALSADALNTAAILRDCNDTSGVVKIPAVYTGTLTLKDSTIASVQAEGNANLVIAGNVKVDASSLENTSAITGTQLNISGNGNLTAIARGKHAYGIGGDQTTNITIENVHIVDVKGGYVQPNFINDTEYGKTEPEGGAAIGSGKNGAVITLNNVTVDNAQGGSKAAGIGALYHTGVTVNINNTTIKNVVGGNASAGIGGSRVSRGATTDENVTINIVNSTVNATGGEFAAGIGGGYCTYCEAPGPIITINIDEDSKITAQGGKYGAGIGTGYHMAGLDGEIKCEVTATPGDSREKYTIAQAVGFGVVDHAKEAKDNNCTINYMGTEIGIPGAQANDADELIAMLENGEDVTLNADIKIDPANMSNAYGTTGINVKNGQTIDGNGHTLDIKGAGGTWDSGINTTGGVIKNITITGSFRGIFINHNSDHSEQVVLENVTIDGTTYTISCDQGNNQTLKATGSTFNGWTSYAATLGSAEFIGCSFGKGNGYAYCRPYGPTTFKNCAFGAGFAVDAVGQVTFENCTIGGVALTADNLATLVTSGTIANATVK